MAELDPETKKEVTRAEHVMNMVQSEGWAIVKAQLDAKILDLQNIANIDMSDPTTLSTQVAARVMAAELLFNWLKGDVYGFIAQQQANNSEIHKEKESDIIDLGEKKE